MEIHIHSLEVLTKTGYYEWERKVGVLLTINCSIDLKSEITNLTETVNYVDLVDLITLVCKKEFLLIENLVEAILESIFNTWKIVNKAKLEVNKPYLPIKNSPKKGISILKTKERKEL